ncbi:MAG: leucine-rich repeat domain-containing protein [Kiritimatiellia bacterium]
MKTTIPHFLTFSLSLSLLLCGCFEEPVPAYTQVAPEMRVYLQEKGIRVLTPEVVYAEGMVFVDAARAADDAYNGRGARAQGAWTNLSARVATFEAATLDYLNLDRNALTNVDALAGFTGLKWLRLNENSLTSLPDLAGLVQLRRIYLRGNRLTEVPVTLKNLPALTDIDLSENPIREVPVWLAEKEGLEAVSLSRTRIVRLPEDLSAWRSLKQLQLGDLHLSREEMKRIRAALPKTAVVF